MRDPKMIEDLIEKAKKFVKEMDYYDLTDVAPQPYADNQTMAREDLRKVLKDLGVEV